MIFPEAPQKKEKALINLILKRTNLCSAPCLNRLRVRDINGAFRELGRMCMMHLQGDKSNSNSKQTKVRYLVTYNSNNHNSLLQDESSRHQRCLQRIGPNVSIAFRERQTPNQGNNKEQQLLVDRFLLQAGRSSGCGWLCCSALLLL